MRSSAVRITETGGREATTRHIAGEVALSVGMPQAAAPAGWRWSALTSLARLESGHTPSRRHPEYWGGRIPWISLTDAKQHHGQVIHDTVEHTNDVGIANSSARLLPAATVCLSRTASVGYVVVTARQMATSQDFVNWICSNELDPHFLKYLFLAEGDGLLRFASGAVHQTIYFPEAKAFHVCHPSINEQRRIVGILDKAFDATATARANAEKNLTSARSIFDAHLQSVFCRRDERWMLKTVAEIARHSLGKMLDKAKNKGQLRRYLRNLNVRWFAFDLTDLLEMRFLPEEAEKYTAVKGDVLICEGGYPGRAAIWKEDTPIYFQKAVHRVRPYEPAHGPWLLYFLYALDRAGTLKQHFTGTGIQHFTGEALRRLQVPLPPLAELRNLTDHFAELDRETKRLESLYQQKLAMLDELKKCFLHHAFAGQL